MAKKKSKVKIVSHRPETGVLKFKGDWSGVFIRGDRAFDYAHHLKAMHPEFPHPVIVSLIELFESCIEPTKAEVQKLKAFDECKEE